MFKADFECEHQRREESRAVRGHTPQENVEFLDSLECYFTGILG